LLGSTVDRAIRTRNAAAFANGTLRFTEKLRLIAGARFTTEDLDARFRRTTLRGSAGDTPAGIGGPPANFPSLTSHDSDFSYRGGLQYYFQPDTMAFVTAARGYKGAAINLINNLSTAVVDSGRAVLRPEISRNYEIGLRTSAFERRLHLNLTGFWTDFKNFQAQGFDATLLAFTLANAGKLRTRGVEAEMTFEPVRGFTVAANAAY